MQTLLLTNQGGVLGFAQFAQPSLWFCVLSSRFAENVVILGKLQQETEDLAKQARQRLGSEKGVFWKRGLCRDPQSVENKGESDHSPESLENVQRI